uniref:Saposin B-type domain-containing protein n=1 Tax=Myripristis murdjan TaxID=586833 RepID=A0A667WX99_9TELE
EEEDFPSQWKDGMMEKEDPFAEENEDFPGLCSACKYIINKIQEKLGKDSSRAKIAELLDKACNYFWIFKSICKQVLNQYRDKLIDFLVKKDNAEAACRSCFHHFRGH